MAGTAAHKRSVRVVGLVAVLLVAATGVVAALHVKAAWTVALAVAAVIALAATGVVDKFVVPGADARQLAQDENQRATSVELILMRDQGGVSLAVTNQDRFEITSVRVDCWPDTAPLPPFAATSTGEVAAELIAGGGQRIAVANLPPLPEAGTGTGPTVGVWTAPTSATPVSFAVDWLDHQRMARRAVGRADLGNPLPITVVHLGPPPPTTARTSWLSRLRRS